MLRSARLIFGADDDAASEYLKDLISSAGLKDAWGESGAQSKAEKSGKERYEYP